MLFIKSILNCICSIFNTNEPDIIEYKIENIIVNHYECIICLEQLKSEDTISLIKCGHMYHTACLYTWFLKKQVCPLCDEILDID